MPAAALLACLAIAGCGGSSAHSTTGSVPVTKMGFDAQVGSLCVRANHAFAAAKTDRAKVAVISHYLTVFHSVKPPAGLQSLYTQYLDVLDQELAALKQGNQKRLFTLAVTKARPLALRLGANGCVSSS